MSRGSFMHGSPILSRHSRPCAGHPRRSCLCKRGSPGRPADGMLSPRDFITRSASRSAASTVPADLAAAAMRKSRRVVGQAVISAPAVGGKSGCAMRMAPPAASSTPALATGPDPAHAAAAPRWRAADRRQFGTRSRRRSGRRRDAPPPCAPADRQRKARSRRRRRAARRRRRTRGKVLGARLLHDRKTRAQSPDRAFPAPPARYRP